MANVLSLALKINADASGLKLDPVEKALKRLGDETDKVTGIFDRFASTSEAAAKAQEQTSKSLEDLIQARREGSVTAEEFAKNFERIREAATQEAAALQRAAQITEANLTPLQRYEKAAADLADQLNAGRISQETYDRALAKAKASLDDTATAAGKTDKNIESLTKNVRILSAIEIGRLLVDGFQALGGIFSSVTNQLTSLVTNVNSSLDTLNDFSARTGIGVESLQAYSLAAKLAGVDTEAFGTAVQKLAVNIGKATPGDALDKSLKGINLSVAELRALSPEQQFAAVGEAISALPTAADRAAAAVQVFGKQGAALAPLFREGAAGIDELRERADRLGIIVSETQVSNIADMNDAFDLVSATIQGIVGQVIGNLAPAVTAVTEEFLKFVEQWQGAEGSGGTGIANAITDVLLNGAEVLAGVFDQFVGNFSGFTEILQGVGETFSFVANILTAAAETLRIIFNVFEGIGNGIALALGKVLEGIGSWVSSDMEAFGQELQRSASAALDQNNKNLEAAATNAATAVQRAFTGDSASPAAAGEGAASQFVQGIRTRFEQEKAPEFKFNTNIEQTRERFDSFFNGIVDQSSAVVAPMREFEAAVAAAQEDGKLTADEIARIEQLQAKVNSSLDQELAKRQETAEAAAKQAEDVDKIVQASLEQMRIDKEFGGDSSRAKAADNLIKIQQEQIRIEEQLAAARATGDQAAIDAATSRLATLDQVAARERDIASGAAKQREAAAKEAEKLNEKIADQQDKLLQQVAENELQRIEALAEARTGSVKVNDLRSGGISQFFETLQEDPALAEAKKQRAELEKIRKEIAKLNAEKVDILAGTG